MNEVKGREYNSIPNSWDYKQIQDVTDVVSGGTPQKNYKQYWENGEIPWATPTDITHNKKKFITNTGSYITELGLKKSSANLLPAGSVLMTSRATIGPRSINTVPMATNQGFKSFICKKNILHNKFLYYLIGTLTERFKALASGSTFLEISKREIESFLIPIPPIKEQQKIAGILSSVDEAIEKTEQIIEQTERIKKGLMQQLFTKGIGHTEFKDSPIGKVPSVWNVKKIKSLANSELENSFIDGDWVESKYIVEDGIRLIQTGNIGLGYLKNSKTKKFITQESFDELNCKEVKEGDILICRLADPIGRSCIVPNLGTKNITSVDIVILRPDETYYNTHFINYLLNSYNTLKKIQSFASGTTRQRISRNNLGSIRISIPPIEEQIEISNKISSVDNKIDIEKQRVAELKEIKQGLMQQLLTGETRVQINENEEVPQ